jgi:bifunctional DNase/RNase
MGPRRLFPAAVVAAFRGTTEARDAFRMRGRRRQATDRHYGTPRWGQTRSWRDLKEIRHVRLMRYGSEVGFRMEFEFTTGKAQIDSISFDRGHPRDRGLLAVTSSPRACVAFIALVAGCAAPAPPTVVVAAPVPSVPEPAPPPRAPEPPSPPPEYVEMHAQRVDSQGDGAALLLVDARESIGLPIYIGGTEGLSIRLRLEGRPYARPLTHDLLDSAVKKLGGQVWKVHIDDLRSGTFIGRVFLRKGDRIIDLDARPSDAVALAIGDRVPIYVAQRVLDQAGTPLEGQDGGAP